LNQDGSINSASNPLGSAITVFGTGFGTMAPPALDGSAPCAPVSKPVATDFPTRVMGYSEGNAVSAPVPIEYIGNAPCLVQGAIQINLRIPDSVKPTGGILTLSSFAGSGSIAVR